MAIFQGFPAKLTAKVRGIPDKVRILRKARPWIFAAMVTALILFAVGAVGGSVYTSRPNFCATCHEMKPEYNTWTASSHSKVACSDCHVEAKPWNLAHKVVALEQLYLHVTDQVPREIRIKKQIENDVCESCHSRQREVTASGDLKVPHAKHIDVEGMSCVDCHATVAHAGITRYDQDLAHKSHEMIAKSVNMVAREFRPSMVSCINCHNEKKVNINCEACHREIKTPTNHVADTWKVKHGKDALDSYNECLFCHDIAKGMPPVTEKRPLEAVRQNDFCLDCHLTRPPEHDMAWVLGHRKAASADKSGCTVCHDEARVSGSPVEKTPACTQCHNSNHNNTWIREHPQVVKRDGMGACFKCHDAKSCSSCHAKYGVDRKPKS